MFIPNINFFEISLVVSENGEFKANENKLILLCINFLENVFESSVVAFKNRVLCRQIQGPFFLQGDLETGMSEIANTFVCIVHR